MDRHCPPSPCDCGPVATPLCGTSSSVSWGCWDGQRVEHSPGGAVLCGHSCCWARLRAFWGALLSAVGSACPDPTSELGVRLCLGGGLCSGRCEPGRGPQLACTHSGHPGRLLRTLLSLSLLFLVAHLVFQICLHTLPRLDQLLGSNCESLWAGRGPGDGSVGLEGRRGHRHPSGTLGLLGEAGQLIRLPCLPGFTQYGPAPECLATVCALPRPGASSSGLASGAGQAEPGLSRRPGLGAACPQDAPQHLLWCPSGSATQPGGTRALSSLLPAPRVVSPAQGRTPAGAPGPRHPRPLAPPCRSEVTASLTLRPCCCPDLPKPGQERAGLRLCSVSGSSSPEVQAGLTPDPGPRWAESPLPLRADGAAVAPVSLARSQSPCL